ncbi:hypothetical protein Tco_1404673 [Tanacetum coccineum]
MNSSRNSGLAPTVVLEPKSENRRERNAAAAVELLHTPNVLGSRNGASYDELTSANVIDRSIGIDNPCLSWTDISQANTVSFELDTDVAGVLYYGIYGVCIGILACRGLSLVSSPLHAMKSQSQIQSSAAVNLGV